MALDPDDPRPPFQQVANALRAAILTRKFTPGEQLPSGAQLTQHYGVSRMTVQNAIRELRDEGLIVSRQGKGVFVRERTAKPIGLRPVIERAFSEGNVTIDFFGFSGETLHGALAEPLDKIRAGQLRPDSVAIRLLLPDTTLPMALPCRADNLDDDPEFRERATTITRRHTEAIHDAVHELAELGLIASGTVALRRHRTAPLFKLYILNGQEAFFGFYPVHEHEFEPNGEPRVIYDLMGKDAMLFNHARAPDDSASTGSQFVDQAVAWFESMWITLGREAPT